MNVLAILAYSGILCLFAWKSEPALPPAINRSGVLQKHIEPSRIANPGDAETRQGFHLLGRLLAWKSQKDTIMSAEKYNPQPRSMQDLEAAVQRASALIEIMAGKLSLDEEVNSQDEHHGDTACGYLALAHAASAELKACFHGYTHVINGKIDYKKLYAALSQDDDTTEPRWN